MKKILLFLISLAIVISCNRKIEEKTITLSDDEKNHATATLLLYQDKNSQTTEHLDSVINYGVDLIKANKGNELSDLLDKELDNFYTPANNTIDNEIKLHELIFRLIYKKGMPFKKHFSKLISLNEHTAQHIESQGSSHPKYTEILKELLSYYIIIEDDKSILRDYNKAILTGKKLSTHALQTDNKEALIYSSLLLAHSYRAEGLQELEDSCNKSIEHISKLYPEAVERTWQFLNR